MYCSLHCWVFNKLAKLTSLGHWLLLLVHTAHRRDCLLDSTSQSAYPHPTPILPVTCQGQRLDKGEARSAQALPCRGSQLSAGEEKCGKGLENKDAAAHSSPSVTPYQLTNTHPSTSFLGPSLTQLPLGPLQDTHPSALRLVSTQQTHHDAVRKALHRKLIRALPYL